MWTGKRKPTLTNFECVPQPQSVVKPENSGCNTENRQELKIYQPETHHSIRQSSVPVILGERHHPLHEELSLFNCIFIKPKHKSHEMYTECASNYLKTNMQSRTSKGDDHLTLSVIRRNSNSDEHTVRTKHRELELPSTTSQFYRLTIGNATENFLRPSLEAQSFETESQPNINTPTEPILSPRPTKKNMMSQNNTRVPTLPDNPSSKRVGRSSGDWRTPHILSLTIDMRSWVGSSTYVLKDKLQFANVLRQTRGSRVSKHWLNELE